MRRTSLFLIASAALLVAGCSSTDSNPQAETGAPTSATTSSVVVSSDNAAVCAGFEQFKGVASATPTGGSDPAENATVIQAYLATLVGPLEAIKAAAPTDLVLSVDTLLASAASAAALDPTSPTDQTTIAQLVLAPPPDNVAATDAVISWAVVNCGIDFDGA